LAEGGGADFGEAELGFFFQAVEALIGLHQEVKS
jgi:hypothetical protein